MADDPLRDPRFPDRPQHQDYWHLSEIILEMDAKFDETEAGGEKANFEEFVRNEVDIESILYMALQRAARLRGTSPGAVATIYIEAFLVGRQFERRYGNDR